MAQSRESVGLTATRIVLGTFFVFEGLSKRAWLTHPGLLTDQLNKYLAAAEPANRWYLETVCLPYAWLLARAVLAGELLGGSALIAGMWTRVVATLLLLMVLNFHFASGAILSYAFLTNGYGLPVLAGLIGLAIGGGRLPLSLRR